MAKFNIFEIAVKQGLKSLGYRNCKINITYALETQAEITFDKKTVKSNFSRTIIIPSEKIII